MPRPVCHDPLGSRVTISGGRSTERMPWAIHLRGKSEAIACIHDGSWLYGK